MRDSAPRRASRGTPADRPGYVLIAVLWTTVAIAACALAAAVAGREAVAAAANRIALTRAGWQAEGCAAHVLAAGDAALSEAAAARGDGLAAAVAWRTFDRGTRAAPVVTDAAGCRITLMSSGTTVDVNTADAPTLARLFAALGAPGPLADTLARAVVTRRDPRAGGRPFATVAEVADVPGFDSASLAAVAPALGPALQTALGVDSARVDVLHAPAPVLASLPGITPEAVDAARALGADPRIDPTVRDFSSFLSRLTLPARAALLAAAPDFAARATFEPDTWVLTARASSGTPAVTAVLELRVARAGARMAVVRRRTWAE